MEVIKYKLRDTTEEHFLEDQGCFLELHELYIRKVLRCRAEVTVTDGDVLGAWEEIVVKTDTVCVRSAFCGVEKRFLRKENMFKVSISFNGVADEVYILMRTENSADKFMDKILGWALGLDRAEPERPDDIV